MSLTREDLLPYYREDLKEKGKRVRRVIENLPKFKIPEIIDVSEGDYDLIKLAVINSIKGEQVAKEERTRQRFVEEVYLRPASLGGLLQYKDTSETGKCDFEGSFPNGIQFGLEVKGGEGNSVTLLSRPQNAEIFTVWSHLDVMSNTPARNMHSVLARLVKQMINVDEKREKVDSLVFYDKWYVEKIKIFKHGPSLPDVFVFPSYIPTKRLTHPDLPNVEDNVFLKTLMKVVGDVSIDGSEARKHVWYCDIQLVNEGEEWSRVMRVFNSFDKRITLNEQESTKATCKPANDN